MGGVTLVTHVIYLRGSQYDKRTATSKFYLFSIEEGTGNSGLRREWGVVGSIDNSKQGGRGNVSPLVIGA